MTVSYSSSIATHSNFAFFKLLLRWKGSIYRLIIYDIVVFSGMYTFISLIYRLALTDKMKEQFEDFCLFSNNYGELIPVGFVLGFFVNIVVTRWWDQFLQIPWLDSLAMLVSAYTSKHGDKVRIQRRTIMRYANLTCCLVKRNISSRARLRFPTEQHIISAGLITEDELNLYNKTASGKNTPLYFLPLLWAVDLINQMRLEGTIQSDRAMELIMDEIVNIRSKVGMLLAYDWINVPLAYTQVVTIAVYSYFMSCLFSWQFLNYKSPDKPLQVDMYIPLFGLLRFIFYMGWLKVAESLINPFGEDQDDFEIEEIIERNLQISYFIVDSMQDEIPALSRDDFWGMDEISLPRNISSSCPPDKPSKFGSIQGDQLFVGSLANMDFTSNRRRSTIFKLV